MKLKFNQYGQTLVLVANGEKFTSRIEDENERNEKRDKIKEIFEKFEKSKSEKVKEKIFNQIKALMVSDNTKKKIAKKQIEKIKIKIEKKSIKSKIKDVINGSKKRKSQLVTKFDSKIFRIENDKVYVLGYDVALPELLVERFLEFINKKQSIQPLLKFWYKCLLNPNQIARTKLFDYLQRHRIIITPHGNFVTYRMVKTTDKEGHYTDAHTKKMNYQIGKAYSLDRATECDEDGSRDCSKGLHTGSPEFIGIKLGDGYNKGKITGNGTGTGYSMPKSFDHTFGNQAVICIIDPQHVVSIPNSDTRKMRSCEIYIAKLTTPEEVLNHLTNKDYDIFDSNYAKIKQDELKKLLKDTKLIDYMKDENLTSKRLENLKAKLEGLKINNDLISNDLSSEQIRNLLKNRLETI